MPLLLDIVYREINDLAQDAKDLTGI